jgi:hypothetical protein
MKTVLSCCTAKLFAQALLPMATMSPPPQAAAGNDNRARSFLRTAGAGTQDAREGRRRGSCPDAILR